MDESNKDTDLIPERQSAAARYFSGSFDIALSRSCIERFEYGEW